MLPCNRGSTDEFLFLNPYLFLALNGHETPSLIFGRIERTKPEGLIERVSDNAMNELRAGKSLTCIDVVITTIRPEDGKPAVLYSMRGPNEAFAGLWWMHGGSVGAYADLIDFAKGRAEKECGVPLSDLPFVWVGMARTCATNKKQDTFNMIFTVDVPWEVVEAKMATDPNHTAIRAFTLREWASIPEGECHWYPDILAKTILDAMENLMPF